jgi:hypothetical protein
LRALCLCFTACRSVDVSTPDDEPRTDASAATDGESVAETSMASDASDSGRDAAAYRACFDSAGSLLPSLKDCTTDSDCAVVSVLACCGGGYELGVSRAGLAAYDMCQANAAPCGDLGCAGAWELIDGALIQDPFSTEDGRVVSMGGAAQVACSSVDGGPRLCRTFVP